MRITVSAVQFKVLQKLVDDRGKYPAPSHYTNERTAKALERKGLVSIVDEHISRTTFFTRFDLVLTEAGAALVAANQFTCPCGQRATHKASGKLFCITCGKRNYFTGTGVLPRRLTYTAVQP